MRRFLLALLVLAACEPDPPPDEPGSITGACVRSFRPTLEAWETRFGRAPEGCAYLDTQVDVQLVAAEDMPCDDEPGSIVVGCTVLDADDGSNDAIYLLEGRLLSQLVDTSVHEWVHVLAACVDGDIDADHLRARLWATYGAETVELQAQASAEIGECL